MADCQSFRSESTICAAAAAANNRHVPRREPSTSSPPATTLIRGQLLAAPRQLQGNLGLFRGVGTAHAREPHRPEPDWASTGHGWFGEWARGATAHTEPSTPSLTQHGTDPRPPRLGERGRFRCWAPFAATTRVLILLRAASLPPQCAHEAELASVRIVRPASDSVKHHGPVGGVVLRCFTCGPYVGTRLVGPGFLSLPAAVNRTWSARGPGLVPGPWARLA